MRATVRDVARRAGVSPKTVSNVVNGTFPVSPGTRTRVEEALAELDYVPNLSARGLRNGRTGVIALALPDLATSYSAELAHHFVLAAGRRGLNVQIEETAWNDRREHELLSRARAQLVDGLILNPVLLETSAVQRGVSLPPVVLIGEVDQPLADHVWHDNVLAAREMTTLLIEEGHRRIAVVGTMDSETSRLRLRGYEEAMAAAGLEVSPDLDIPTRNWNPAGGAAAMSGYLDAHELPDAIFCFTDAMAMGVLSVLWAAGHRVPEDVSVVGYDDVMDASYSVPALTTVRFEKQDLAETALELLIERIADNDREITSVMVHHSIVRRHSTRARS
ncbi:MAG: LacI family DNA-binding transcriptional regulator [Propionibacteriaceae bacterium]